MITASLYVVLQQRKYSTMKILIGKWIKAFEFDSQGEFIQGQSNGYHLQNLVKEGLSVMKLMNYA